MNIIVLIIVLVALVLLVTGGLVQALNWLIWAGIIALIAALIIWIIRSLA